MLKFTMNNWSREVGRILERRVSYEEPYVLEASYSRPCPCPTARDKLDTVCTYIGTKYP